LKAENPADAPARTFASPRSRPIVANNPSTPTRAAPPAPRTRCETPREPEHARIRARRKP